jgi:hypothetical protein
VIAVLGENHAGSVKQDEPIEFRIPIDGVMIVADDSVLHKWHTTIVSTTDGTISRAHPAAITGQISGSNLIFLERDSGETKSCRENWFHFGDPAGADLKQLDHLEMLLKKCGCL